MNQAMHTWIATVLSMLTVKILFPTYKFSKITKDFGIIGFAMDWAGFVMFCYFTWRYMV